MMMMCLLGMLFAQFRVPVLGMLCMRASLALDVWWCSEGGGSGHMLSASHRRGSRAE